MVELVPCDELAFAARRLPEGGVGLLASLRTDPDTPTPSLLADLGAALPLTRHTVAPMGADRLTNHSTGPSNSPAAILPRALWRRIKVPAMASPRPITRPSG